MQVITRLSIIGGGPAGCAAALSAIKSGIEPSDILIIEKEPYDRHRIGEILLTQTILEFKNLGIAEEMAEYAKKFQWAKKFAAGYVYGENRTPWKVQNNHPLASEEDQPHIPRCFVDPETKIWYTLMVRRHEFDESLREICAKRGVKFLHGSVKNVNYIVDEEDKFNSTVKSLNVRGLDEKDYSVLSGFIIDASGQQAIISRKMGTRETIGDMGLQARFTYFEGVDFENAKKHGLLEQGANILSYEDGWSWIAYLGRGLTSVGIVSRHWDKNEKNFWEKLKNLPEYHIFRLDKAIVKDYKGNPIEADHFYAHPNYRFRSEIMRGKNWAACGDAAIFLDPLLSQGVTLGLSFGSKLGTIATMILNDGVPAKFLQSYEATYIAELEVLNKIVSLWYTKDFSFDKKWKDTADKISHVFGRDIGSDIESFRWISNLENMHYLANYKNYDKFLEKLNTVNTIKQIHDFEKYGLINF